MQHNQLWWTDACFQDACLAWKAGDPVLHAVEQQARRHSSPQTAGMDQLEALALTTALDARPDLASAIVQRYLALTEIPESSDLSRSRHLLCASFLCESLAALLPEADLQALLLRTVSLVRSMRRPNPGNPHDVNNNWWAVTHSAALIGALTALGLTEHDLREDRDWARFRLEAFLHHFGDRGLYHEGLGYQGYTCTYLLSALWVLRQSGTANWLVSHPNLRYMLSSLYAATFPRIAILDSEGPAPGGSMLTWNDAQGAWGASPVDYIGMRIAPPEQQAALRHWFDRICGLQSPRPSFGDNYGSLLLAWTLYPRTLPESDGQPLPTRVTDTRQGLMLRRNRYQDANDIVFGLYARATHVGGHAQEDSGSIRLSAFGSDWIAGPGQNRPNAEWQSVVVPSELPGNKQKRCAAVLYREDVDQGFVIGMDLRKVSIGYHERYLAARWDTACGAPLAFALLDQVDDHLTRTWTWNWTHCRSLSFHPDADGRGFQLHAPDGQRLQLRFLGSAPDAIEQRQIPPTHRVFSGGNREDYIGKPYIAATFAPSPCLGIYAVAAIGQGTAPTIEGTGLLDCRINGQLWSQPFGAAIPAAFVPGRPKGLCLHGHGEPQ